MKFYCEDVDLVLREVRSRRTGLSAAEAAERLVADGRNKLAEARKDSLLKRFLQQLADPMILILLAAAAVSGVLTAIQGESFADVIIILAVVLINAVLGVVQENKAEKAIEALQELSADTSKVLRDGQVCTVRSGELVVGDVVLLEAGDAVPADGRLIECASLRTEEAALTGEPVPVSKSIDPIDLKEQRNVSLGDRKNMVYMGSTVVYGRGAAVLTATGMGTEMGKIAGALTGARADQTPLQRKLCQLSRILTWMVLGICAVIFAVQLLRTGGFSTQGILHAFLIAVSLAVAAIPEGLVAVVTVVLAIGVTNLSRRGAIIRKLTAVETLGCAQIICSDKTGTLTQNKMTVVDFYGSDERQLAAAMALCSDAEQDSDGAVTGEPTEAALVTWAAALGLNKHTLKEKMPRIGEAPFDSGRTLMSTVHRLPDGSVLQFTKGAPDVLLGRCTHVLRDGKAIPITEEDRAEILRANRAMADRAIRVLACARRDWDAVPDTFEPESIEENLCFMGLCGMIDPVRPEVRDAIAQCRSAGIRPIMITGDHVDTAAAIARELGILTEDVRAVTGAELDGMDDAEFEQQFRSIAVYARVQPEHKTRIVDAWRKAGYVTAMTGDGVNDAPSIQAADIGVGMGVTGTDVTKNVADMVLSDDNFATIVRAVEEGRRIYDNIRKAIQFLLGSNLSEVISIFAATLMGFPILEPVHLLWINLVTDCFPALALGMEPAEPDIMRRPPRDARAGIFAGGMGLDIACEGLMVAVLTLLSYFTGHYLESGVWEIAASRDGMTMAFLTLSMAEVFHSFNLRSRRGSIFRLRTRNFALLGAAIAALLATTLVCEVPFLAAAFSFTAVSLNEYLVAVGLGFLVIPIVETIKFFQRRAARS